MGGHATIAVRTQDGDTHVFMAGKGNLRAFSLNILFYEKHPQYVQEYIQSLSENGEVAPLVPSGYGIVVYDFLRNYVVSHQGFTNVNSFVGSQVRVAASYDDPYWARVVEGYRSLYDDGRLSASRWSRDLDEHVSVPMPQTWEELVDAEGSPLNEKALTRYEVDTTPFSVYEEDVSSQALTEVHDILIDLGFQLSEEDEAQWVEAINALT